MACGGNWKQFNWKPSKLVLVFLIVAVFSIVVKGDMGRTGWEELLVLACRVNMWCISHTSSTACDCERTKKAPTHSCFGPKISNVVQGGKDAGRSSIFLLM